MFSPPANATFASGLVGLVLWFSLPQTSQASFVVVGKVTDEKQTLRLTLSWTLPDEGSQKDEKNFPTNNWNKVELDSPATIGQAAPTPRNLFVGLTHNGAPHTGILSFTNIGAKKGVTVTSAAQVNDVKGTTDYYFGSVKPAQGGKFDITLKGDVEVGKVGMTVSFKNSLDHPVNGQFIPSINGKSDFDAAEAFKDLQPGKTAKATFLGITDFTVETSGSGLTTTTLAFLGTAEGVPGIGELDLGSMSKLLAGFDEWLAPQLLDSSGGSLNIFVNLTQWLGSETTFSPLQSFTISGGVNDSLPGVFVSTTPITVNPDGSLQGTPFTGQAFVAGVIDGQAVAPAPSGLLLAISGLLSFVPCTLRCCRPVARHHGTSAS
jgi:hypothetical protein